MQKFATALLAVLLLASIGLLFQRVSERAEAEASQEAESAARAEPEAKNAPDAGVEPEKTDTPESPDKDSLSEELRAILNGGPVPPLPPDAPTSVDMGVALFSYAGAELAPANAPKKDVALKRARALIDTAKQDFGEVVKLGDSTSLANAGRIPRDVLEPKLEYVLFTLKKGEVFPEPVDTPRGYWILRRTR